MVVAIGVGREGVDTLLIASQVVLSIVLPFIIFPLMYLTSSKMVMSVRKTSPSSLEEHTADCPSPTTLIVDVEASGEEVVDYSNGKVTIFFGYFIWVVVIAANFYAIITLAMGEGGSS